MNGKPTYRSSDIIPLESMSVLSLQDGDVLVFRTARKITEHELDGLARITKMIKAHTGKDISFVILDDEMDLSILRPTNERQTK